MKKIGIIGGISPESTLMYYRYLIDLSHKKLEKYEFPEIIIYSLDFRKIVDSMQKDDWKTIERNVQYVVDRFEGLGVQVCAIASNTIHYIFNNLKTNMEMVNIVDSVIEEALKRGYKRVLVLGTLKTMKEGLYAKPLRNVGIEPLLLKEEEMELVQDIIFDISEGKIETEKLLRLKEILQIYTKSKGVDALLLGCTELPIILKDEGFEVLDSTKIHSEKIFERAVIT